MKHYELYRRMRLIAMGFGDAGIGDSSTFERKWAEHRASLQKREDDMRQIFVDKVSATPACSSSAASAAAAQNQVLPDNVQERSYHKEKTDDDNIEVTSDTSFLPVDKHTNNSDEDKCEKELTEEGGASLALLNDTNCPDESLIWDDYLDELRYPVDGTENERNKQERGDSASDKLLMTSDPDETLLEFSLIDESLDHKLSIDDWESHGSSLLSCRKDWTEGEVEDESLKASDEVRAASDASDRSDGRSKRTRCSNRRKVTFEAVSQEAETTDNSECLSMSESTGRVKMLASRFDSSFH